MVGVGVDCREKFSHIVRREGPAQKLFLPAKDRNSEAEGLHQFWIVCYLNLLERKAHRKSDAGFLNECLGVLAEVASGRTQKLQRHAPQRPPSAS